MTIEVSSHVARDFLQNAAYFNNVLKVVWEYVSNSLDNPRNSEPVVCEVSISKNRILVKDNASGMSQEDLKRFFQMHGENIQRAVGRLVRGRFGTGKCAAFGIADVLRVETVKDGFKNVVELHRTGIEEARTGEPFPVKEIVIDEFTVESPGTIIEITNINLSRNRIDVKGSIDYVERHLGRHQQVHSVIINGHLCQYQEQSFVREEQFQVPSNLKDTLGNVVCIIRVSPTPLSSALNGIDILSNGIWHETTLVELGGKEMVQYIFGEIDVPALELDNSPIPSFDNTRSGCLNPENQLVRVLYSWLQDCIENVRLQLVKEERQRRASEEAKRLSEQAQQIAEVLNEDFEAYRRELARASASAGHEVGPLTALRDLIGGEDSSEVLPGEGEEESSLQEAGAPHKDGESGDGLPRDGEEPRTGLDFVSGQSAGSSSRVSSKGRKSRRGGFSIDYRNETEDAPRSRYEGDTKIIVINLDHPQVNASIGGDGLENQAFRQLSYEIAFTEYALAIPHELADKLGEYYDAIEAIAEVREIVDRISRRTADLFRNRA